MTTQSDKSSAMLVGAVLLGAAGGLAVAAWAVVAGHGLFVAFLGYVAGGMALTLAALAGRLAVDAANRHAVSRARRNRAARTA